MKNIFLSPKELILDTNSGFISKEKLYSLLDQLCLEIKYPLTLIYLDKQNKLQRIDSERVGFLLDKSCDTFRRFGGYEACLENDSNHAKPYLFKEKEVPECGYEMYKCKYMGYHEYVFPIRIENSVIAVLFVGQVQIFNEPSIVDAKKATVSKYEEIFKKKLLNSKYSKIISYDDIVNRIISNNEDPFLQINMPGYYDVNKKISRFDSQDSAEKYISNKILPRISKFQNNLENILLEYRKQHITKILSVFENNYNDHHIKFLKDYDILEEKGNGGIDKYWYSQRELFCELKKQFDIREIIYYEQKRESNNSKNIYEIKISTDSEKIGNEEILDNDNFNDPSYIVDERALLKYVFKIDFLELSAISDKLRKHFISEFSRLMKSTIDICSYSIHSKVDSNNNLTTLRIYRHEMDQLILTLDSINYKLSPNYKEELDKAKIEKMHKDFTSSLDSANYMSKNIEYFTRSQRGIKNDYGPKERVNIFNKLNKWRLFVMDNTIKKYSNVIVPSEEVRRQRSENNYAIFCVENGLESILYNIINNAIKYCHRGTNIYLDCQSIEIEGKIRKIITVTDYGRGIDSKHMNDIFKLYYRDTDTSVNIDGSGIGLYLSKLIADDIGMKIQYNCEFVSKYNIPLIKKYIENFGNIKNDLTENILNEYKINSSKFDKIVSPFSRKISDLGVKNEIVTPTYKVTFEVII